METNLHNYLQGIADAIKEKTGDTTINAQDFASKIASIGAGGGESIASILDGSIDGDYNDETLSTLRDYAFCNCTNLQGVNLPSVNRVGIGCFNACSSLKEAYLPNVTFIGLQGFYQCSELEVISLPRITTINNQAFRYCTKLRRVDLGSPASINIFCFEKTSVDTLIIRTSSVCSLAGTNAFTDTPIGNGTGSIYVPNNLVEDYKAQSNWLNYASQIKPLSDLLNE